MSARTEHEDLVNTALPAFFSEAAEQIELLEQLLLQLESSPSDRPLLDSLFRCAHTVKGSSGIFGLDDVVAFTHHLETLLDKLRDGTVSLTAEVSTLVLRAVDEIRILLRIAESPDDAPDDPARRRDVVIALQGAAGIPSEESSQNPVPATPSLQAPTRWHIAVRFGPDTFRNGMDPLAILAYLQRFGTIRGATSAIDDVPPLDELDPETCHVSTEFDFETDAVREQIESAFSFVRDHCDLKIEHSSLKKEERHRERRSSEKAEETRFIRVQADRLDAVINLIGELVIASAGASMLARQTRQMVLSEANQHVGQLVEDIRNATLQLRMVPIGETFSRFRRVVRDTAADLGKEVDLEIRGGETELDKSMVERIADPLMHLVRNALDHGLEQPHERAAAGKPSRGKLTLAACHESGSILIRIVDDGRGIDRRKLLESAWARGVVDRGTVLSDRQVLELIFAAGVSTAEKVTNLSGRGVGMDVVRTNVQAMRGSISVHSEVGDGTKIDIRLPLTLAIIDGFLVAVGQSKFIFPLESVMEVIENRPTTSSLDPHGRGTVELRDQILPVVELRSLYGLDSPRPDRVSIVVIQAGGRRYGVMVDQLHGQHQTVIKPLSRLFRSLRGISGSSILGNGEVALIFDAVSLGDLAASVPVGEKAD